MLKLRCSKAVDAAFSEMGVSSENTPLGELPQIPQPEKRWRRFLQEKRGLASVVATAVIAAERYYRFSR